MPLSVSYLHRKIHDCLTRRDTAQAVSLLRFWLTEYFSGLPPVPTRDDLLQPDLWITIALVAEQSHDPSLVELFWQKLDSVPLELAPLQAVPVLGVPILNRVDLLERLLASLDVDVEVLAIVDNSVGQTSETEVRSFLHALETRGHPRVGSVRTARPFANLGVAASWNLILSSFPDAQAALIVNNDIAFPKGLLANALAMLDPARPQFLSLMKGDQAFSAFFITPAVWDRIGLFDADFYPAYGEDLDYRERLRSHPEVEILDSDVFHEVMASLNPDHSATIRSDPRLASANRASHALNYLWYLSHRRIRGDRRGSWRRRWLNQWLPPPP